MPDGDKIHYTLPHRYQHVYAKICEGRQTPDDIARDVLRQLKKDARENSENVMSLLKGLVGLLGLMPTASMDEAGLRRWIQDQIRYCNGSTRYINFAARACQRLISNFTSAVPKDGLLQSVVYEFFVALYDGRFAQHLPLTNHHLDNVSQDMIEARLATIWPLVEKGIASLSAQAARRGSMDRLRLPPRTQKLSPVGLHEDLLRPVSG